MVGGLGVEQPTQGPNEDALQFLKLLKGVKEACYKGCKKFSKILFIVYLYHLECLNGWSNKLLTMLLQFLQRKNF